MFVSVNGENTESLQILDLYSIFTLTEAKIYKCVTVGVSSAFSDVGSLVIGGKKGFLIDILTLAAL